MILKSFNKYFFLLIALSIFSPLNCEEKIDIWKNKKNSVDNQKQTNPNQSEKKINLDNKMTLDSSQSIKIENNLIDNRNEIKVFGVYDPEDYNFNLNMWSSTKADDFRASLKRIEKISLSKTSNEILENVLLSFSYPPEGMDEKEFANLKIDWLIRNNRIELIESFLKQNKEFNGKKKAVQHLVDNKISKANIKEGCEKVEFIDSTIKDSYLEKFKIYCLVFNNKKSQSN